MARHWYDLTDSTSTNTPLKFPFKTLVPWLNQTIESIKYYYSVDPFESRYMMLLATISNVVEKRFVPQLFEAFKNLPFFSNEEYVALYKAWNIGLTVCFIVLYFITINNANKFPVT